MDRFEESFVKSALAGCTRPCAERRRQFASLSLSGSSFTFAGRIRRHQINQVKSLAIGNYPTLTRRAAKSGFFREAKNRKFLTISVDLAPLRGREDLQKFLKSLDKP